MRVKFLTVNIEQVGGIESVVKRLSSYFVDIYHYEVEIISFFGEKKSKDIPGLSSNVKRIYWNLEVLDENNRFSQYSNILKYNNIIKSKLRDLQCDILISTHFLFNMLLVLNKKYLDFKLIGSEHSDYFQAGRLVRITRNIFYRRLDKFVVLTKHAYTNYSKYLKNVIIINNACSFKSDVTTNFDNNKIIALGRLEEEKGFTDLIDILSTTLNESDEWEVEIFGDGSKKNEIVNKIKEYKLQDKVCVRPFTNNVKKELLQSSIFILPSRSEAFPLVLLEAMECGLAVISNELSGPSEIIKNNENGIIVKSKQEFSHRLRELMDNQKIMIELGKNGKKEAGKYSIESICKKWRYMFETLNQYKK